MTRMTELTYAERGARHAAQAAKGCYIDNIDLEELLHQRDTLQALLTDLSSMTTLVRSQESLDALEGVLNLLDHIVDRLEGWPERADESDGFVPEE